MSESAKRFDWLKNYLENEEDIANIQLNLTRTKLELTRWTEGDLAHVHLERGSHGNKLESIIGENERLLAEDIAIRNQTLNLLDKFDGIENRILKLKYVDGLSLSQIADIDGIGYSYSTIKKIHAELRRRLKFLDMWDIPEQFNEGGGSKKVHPKKVPKY